MKKNLNTAIKGLVSLALIAAPLTISKAAFAAPTASGTITFTGTIAKECATAIPTPLASIPYTPDAATVVDQDPAGGNIVRTSTLTGTALLRVDCNTPTVQTTINATFTTPTVPVGFLPVSHDLTINGGPVLTTSLDGGGVRTVTPLVNGTANTDNNGDYQGSFVSTYRASEELPAGNYQTDLNYTVTAL